jgi:hypothetical protein
MKGETGLDPRIWFEHAADSGRVIRITADPMNIKPRSVRVISDWNRISAEKKKKPTAASFNAEYASHREMTMHSATMERGRAS